MIGYPEAIPLAALFLAGGQAVVVAIKTKAHSNGADPGAMVFRDTCDAKHAGIERELSSINEKLNILIGRHARG